MNNKMRRISIIAVVMLLFASTLLVGCGNKEEVTSDDISRLELEAFGTDVPIMGQYDYSDAENKVVDNKIVPTEFEQAAEHQGKLEYVYYNTKDYDDDMHDMEKRVVVYTPYGYDESKEYDILYVLHGHTGGVTTWLGSPSNPYEAKNVVDHMVETGMIRPTIIVSMTYYDDNTDEETSDYDVQLLEPFGQELRNDIIPTIESKYSTYAKTTDEVGLKASRDHRIMGGFSMGGVTANIRILDSMDLFRYYMPISGSLYWSTNRDLSETAMANKFQEVIKAQGYTKDDFFIYLSTGTNDFAKRIVEKQVSAMKTSEMFTQGKPGEAGVNLVYGLGQGEGHNAHGRETAIYNVLPAISSLIGQNLAE